MIRSLDRPRHEVAEIVRVHGGDSRRAHDPSPAQEKVLRHLATCRTSVLGGHIDRCDSCGFERISYNSCRDRHCPKCQSTARAEWLEARLERLLPTPHVHVVFTLPEELHPLALGNKKVVFDILFAAAAETLREIAHDEKHLGAQLGFTAVLHTWGQNLLFHPHLHCVVTGGGLSPEGDRWIPARENFFLPVRVLGALFRGKFLHHLHDAYRQGRLLLGGSTASFAQPPSWRALLDRLYRKSWVVYAKPPFDGTDHVFRYLARYTHRVAIANRRIVAFENGRVTFTLKDYADEGKRKRMTLDAVEFLRRFLLHVLPKGFSRIRHYGLYAARNVDTRCALARRRLEPLVHTPDPEDAHPATQDTPWWERLRERTGIDLMACPHCRTGRLVRLSPAEWNTEDSLAPTGTDPPFPDAGGGPR